MKEDGFFNKWQSRLFSKTELDKTKSYYIASNRAKYLILCSFSLLVIIFSFILNSPTEIFEGLGRIIVAPGVLITDYMAVGNPGAAFFNSGMLMLVCIAIAAITKIDLKGPIIAVIFTVGGFALFGKTIFNILPIIGGVYLYGIYQRKKFANFILPALFGTALGPLVSLLAFGFGFELWFSLPLSILAGLIVGFFLPAMASHFIVFHQGYNLYNVGFTCGIAGLVVMSLLRSFGLKSPEIMIVSQGNNLSISIFLFLYFLIMVLIGLIYTRTWIKSQANLYKQSGRLVSDFVVTDGFGPSLINMGLLGILMTGVVLALGGQLNGPFIGGIFTVVGFGAFGKHVRNVLPIVIGVYLASLLKIWEPDSLAVILAALFGTSLAPIAGTYGWFYGIVAGFIHLSVVMNVGYLHGGINLYNNGFSAGFVAAVLVPIINGIQSRFQKPIN